MLELTEPQEIIKLVEREVKQLLQKCHIDEPPVDAYVLAESLGLGVQIDATLKARGYSRRRWDTGTIVVGSKNPSKSERKQFTIAHEIGEVLLAGKVGQRRLEEACNLMAVALLLPREWFGKDAQALGFHLLRLKERYSTVSHEVIAYRMLDFKPFIITIFDNGRLYRRKSSYPGPIKKAYPLELKCLEEVGQKGEERLLEDEEVVVAGWPVFREDWKRVILRTELQVGRPATTQA